MTNTSLKVLEGPDGEAMYFVRGKEVATPKMLPHPIRNPDWAEIVAFSEGGLRPGCLFTKDDVEGLILETAETVPNWIARLESH